MLVALVLYAEGIERLSNSFYSVPSEKMNLMDIEEIEIFYIPERRVVSSENWPDLFWTYTHKRQILDHYESKHVLELFSSLKKGEPARCHMPPWGIAFYGRVSLLYSVTLCFECSNCYVYSGVGKFLTAFEVDEDSANKLLNFMMEKLSLSD